MVSTAAGITLEFDADKKRRRRGYPSWPQPDLEGRSHGRPATPGKHAPGHGHEP